MFPLLPRSFNWIIFLCYALAAKLRAEQKFFHTLLLVLYKEDLKFSVQFFFTKETPAFLRVLSKFCVWFFWRKRLLSQAQIIWSCCICALPIGCCRRVAKMCSTDFWVIQFYCCSDFCYMVIRNAAFLLPCFMPFSWLVVCQCLYFLVVVYSAFVMFTAQFMLLLSEYSS